MTGDNIDNLVLTWEYGELELVGPLSVEHDGSLWTVTVPTDDGTEPGPWTQDTLRASVGMEADIIADGTTVASGRVARADEPDGEGEIRVVVDQYAKDTMTDEPPKSAEEIAELRDRIAAVVDSDELESGSKAWQKLEAAEAALDWTLGELEGFPKVVELQERRRREGK